MTEVQATAHKPKCEAERKGKPPCGRPAGWGTPHPGIGRCKLHGGCTPNHVKGAQIEQARRVVANLGIGSADPKSVDPIWEIICEIARARAAVDWCEEQIAQLDRGELTFGVVRESIEEGSGTGQKEGDTNRSSTVKAAGKHPFVKLWHEERDKLRTASVEAVKIGLAEREIRLAEMQGQLIAQVVRSAAADPEMGLSPLDQRKFASVVGRHLRTVQQLPEVL